MSSKGPLRLRHKPLRSFKKVKITEIDYSALKFVLNQCANTPSDVAGQIAKRNMTSQISLVCETILRIITPHAFATRVLYLLYMSQR